MTERDLRYTSWIISVTSIVYGVIYSIIAILGREAGVANLGYYYYVYYILFFGLIIFGFLKILGLAFVINKIRRVSIVSLMFVWGFIWTSNIVECFTQQFDDKAITLFPIVAICAYTAFRGDYH